jgi:hypothetical protein
MERYSVSIATVLLGVILPQYTTPDLNPNESA